MRSVRCGSSKVTELSIAVPCGASAAIGGWKPAGSSAAGLRTPPPVPRSGCPSPPCGLRRGRIRSCGDAPGGQGICGVGRKDASFQGAGPAGPSVKCGPHSSLVLWTRSALLVGGNSCPCCRNMGGGGPDRSPRWWEDGEAGALTGHRAGGSPLLCSQPCSLWFAGCSRTVWCLAVPLHPQPRPWSALPAGPRPAAVLPSSPCRREAYIFSSSGSRLVSVPSLSLHLRLGRTCSVFVECDQLAEGRKKRVFSSFP